MHWINSISADEKEAEGGRKDKRISAAKFPLNQLTWPEVARMIILSQILADQGKGREDVQQALRGSRQPNFRIAKNVIRCIRYRLASRMQAPSGYGGQYRRSAEGGSVRGSGSGESDDLLHMLYSTYTSTELSQSALSKHINVNINVSDNDDVNGSVNVKIKGDIEGDKEGDREGDREGDKEGDREGDVERGAKKGVEKGVEESSASNMEDVGVYSSESEVVSALVLASSDPAYSEIYQRCCKVLVKIGNLSQAKHFFWEIDSVMFPDYYASVKRPMMISNVTANLVRQSYGSDSVCVAQSFYTDMRQVVLNCFAYNTEITAVHAQAQKIYQVIIFIYLIFILSLVLYHIYLFIHLFIYLFLVIYLVHHLIKFTGKVFSPDILDFHILLCCYHYLSLNGFVSLSVPLCFFIL